MGETLRAKGIAGWRALVAVVLLAGLVWVAVTPVWMVGAQVGYDPVPPTQAVSPAECGPGSRPETGLQGQVPMADRDSGRSAEGYQCNLELVGTYQRGEGASWQVDWYSDCAYYSTLDSPTRSTKPGAVVLDVSDPSAPVETAVLDTPAVNDPHESLKVNERRGLLGAVDLDDPFFDVYDVADDCTKPELLASVELPGTGGHEGEWTPDGLTYYGAPSSGGGNVYAIDVSDPTNPSLLHTLPRPAHGLNFSDDGTRAYLSSLATRQEPNGLVILDVSDIQERKPDPQTPVIGEVYWPDGALAQHPIPVTIKGTPYLIFVDEAARGAVRVIDISDETRPVVVAKLKLEVHLPQNEAATQQEWASSGPIFVYDAHYCSVDRFVEPTALACGYFESGIRVFDIHDPLAPVEIAYFNPPAITDRPLPASSHGGGPADHCAAQVRLLPSAGQLWTMCQDNEFMTLEFTNGVWPTSWPARSTAAACGEQPEPAGYRDVEAESTHAAAIDCVRAFGIASGKTPSRFAPGAAVTRGEAASFVARLVAAAGVELAAGRDRFSDDAGSVHEDAINRLAGAGVVSGRTATGFEPDASVSRGEMATILAKGYELAAGKPLVSDDDFFADDAGSTHEDAINRLTGAAIVSGTSTTAYTPGRDLTRAETASLLARTLAQLADDGKVEPLAS